MAADGHHPGQHASAHADPQGQGKLRLDARGRLRGKGVDELRGTLRFRATRDNRGDDAACPALALAMCNTKACTISTFMLPFFAAPNTPTATSCAKSLPSFAASNTGLGSQVLARENEEDRAHGKCSKYREIIAN